MLIPRQYYLYRSLRNPFQSVTGLLMGMMAGVFIGQYFLHPELRDGLFTVVFVCASLGMVAVTIALVLTIVKLSKKEIAMLPLFGENWIDPHVVAALILTVAGFLGVVILIFWKG